MFAIETEAWRLQIYAEPGMSVGCWSGVLISMRNLWLELICSMAGLALQETPVGEILSLPLDPTYYSCSLTTPDVWLLRQVRLLENVIQQRIRL